MKHGSLFSGIGGFDLAAEWMGWENVFHCELNEFGRRVLKYYWPLAKSYDDITKTDFIIWLRRLGILTGGFPCQGFSLAGSRLGTDDYRYLWPEMLRTVRQSRPTWIVGENVAGIKSMEDKSGVWKEVFARVENRKVVRYDTVDLYEAVYTRQVKMLVSTICEDLEKEGYKVQPIIIPAAAVGAPHRRERIWFIAHSDRYSESAFADDAGDLQGRLGKVIADAGGMQSKRRGGFGELGSSPSKGEGKEDKREWIRNAASHCGENITDSYDSRLQGSKVIGGIGGIREDGREQSSRFFRTAWRDFPTQSAICNGDDGLSTKLDGITFSNWRTESLKGGGNAIVPQVAYEIFKAIQSVNDSL